MTAAVGTLKGQQLSLWPLVGEDRLAFDAAVRERVPAGGEFTVNDIRDLLDVAGIPESTRAGLFAGAARRGLIEPVVVQVGHRVVPVQVPSTGASAHRAMVRVWRRIETVQ